MLEVQLVPKGRILEALTYLGSHLQNSVEHTHGRMTVDDIAALALAPHSQLWVVMDNHAGNVEGYLLTEIKPYTKKTMFVVHYCAMTPHIKSFVEDQMHAVMENFARSSGCHGVEFFGRPGWRKHAKKFGYDAQMVVYEKHFYG
jgi:hypothetical protein